MLNILPVGPGPQDHLPGLPCPYRHRWNSGRSGVGCLWSAATVASGPRAGGYGAAMADHDRGHDFGVDWVDVSIEPHHLEQFRTHGVRVYEVRIPPGTPTQFHRHDRDTIYVLTAGGRFRSQEPGHQRSRTALGRSTPLPTQLRLLAARLRRGWFEMPTGTVILQPHRSLPLIHRVTAHPFNSGDVAMVGVELSADYRYPGALPQTAALQAEHHGPRWPVYRLRVGSGGDTTLSLPGGGVLVVVDGTASLPGRDLAVTAGQVRWLAPGSTSVQAAGGLDAVVVPT